MFGISGFEFFLILLFAFLIVGPDRLPEFAKKAGTYVARFREAKSEMDKVIKSEVYDANADDPFQQPIDALKKMSDQVENAKTGETFSQRKARYDAERAAERKAAQRAQQEAERQAAAQAAESAQATENEQTAEGEHGVSAAQIQTVQVTPATATTEQVAPTVSVTAQDSSAQGTTQAAQPVAFDPAELYAAQPVVAVNAQPAIAVNTQPAEQAAAPASEEGE